VRSRCPSKESGLRGAADHESSIGSHVTAARQHLRNAGIPPDIADVDARLIAQYVLGWTTERFLTDVQLAAPEGFGDVYDNLVGRRRAREPLAYIVGHREFWGLEMEVTPAVLVPRPETELLVESVLERFPRADAAVRIADACTGSGCVAVAIARERPAARIVATDISGTALAVARRNAVRHHVASRIALVRADLLRGIAGPFDAIVANPPYVPYCAGPALDPEVAHREPGLAIFGGEDGMAVIEQLVPQAPALIRAGGLLLFEFGFGQADVVADIVSGTPGLTLLELRPDLQGIPRVAIARRTASGATEAVRNGLTDE
jgi:release factor glutamine methyltransferase